MSITSEAIDRLSNAMESINTVNRQHELDLKEMQCHSDQRIAEELRAGLEAEAKRIHYEEMTEAGRQALADKYRHDQEMEAFNRQKDFEREEMRHRHRMEEIRAQSVPFDNMTEEGLKAFEKQLEYKEREAKREGWANFGKTVLKCAAAGVGVYAVCKFGPGLFDKNGGGQTNV